ncbi:MAG TPA: glycoside hydrolase family 3 N-terminal domain-containing protein [Bryobacteraceae bacterium]|nr:glycoside hydrolase family 3 N-terminal domain-containing protein [Bryobacteraceae bacterium]
MNLSRRNFVTSSAAALGATLLMKDVRAATAGRFSQYDQQARGILAQMSLAEKIGQMTQPDKNYLKSPDDVANYSLGSVLSGGDSDPKTGNDLISWTDTYDLYQEPSLHSRPHIPLLYGVDAVHGHNNVIGAVIFPHNIGLGCTRNPDLERAAQVTSEEVRGTGINWAFACPASPPTIWGTSAEAGPFSGRAKPVSLPSGQPFSAPFEPLPGPAQRSPFQRMGPMPRAQRSVSRLSARSPTQKCSETGPSFGWTMKTSA